MSVMQQLCPSRAASDLGGAITDLETQGYCLVHDAIPPSVLHDVRSRLTEQADAEWHRHIEFQNPAHIDPANQWVNMLLNKGEIFQRLALNAAIAPLVEHLLGSGYLLSACDAQVKHAGTGAMPLHSDQWWLPKPVQAGEEFQRPATIERNHGSLKSAAASLAPINPPVVVVVMWMISQFTQQNGATRIVPGSHHSGGEPDPSVPHVVPTVAATGAAGTALVFDGRTWHGAGENLSQHTRYAITCGFVAPQFRTLENYPRALRPEVAQSASPELLRLIGFRSWGIYGHAGDPADEVLTDGANALGELSAQ